MKKIPGIVAAALILPFLSSFSFAETPPSAPDDDTDWTVDVPTKTPTGGVAQPTTPEGGFSQPDRIIFGEKMREHVLDQICRNAQIPLGHKFDLAGYGSAGADVVRRLRRLHHDALVPLPDGLLERVPGFVHCGHQRPRDDQVPG